MTIHDSREGRTLTVALEGRLDTLSSPELESYLSKNIDTVDNLIFDIENLEYISSAGLRVILRTYKILQNRGELVIRHPNKAVMSVFELTGFKNMMKIEQ